MCPVIEKMCMNKNWELGTENLEVRNENWEMRNTYVLCRGHWSWNDVQE